eukprot:403347260
MMNYFNRRLFSVVQQNQGSFKRALYAGSFDPPSNGHLDIIERGSSLCDELHIGVAINNAKKPIFPLEERIRLLKKVTHNKENIKIIGIEGLLVDYAEQNNIDFFVRGIRSFSDFDSEFSMGIINRRLSGKETIFLMASSSRVHISSSRIRELSIRLFSVVQQNQGSFKRALYAGSFDPPSNGHLDIIERGSSLCDELHIGVAINNAKKPIFPLEERIRLLKKVTHNKENIKIIGIEGLLVDYAEQNNIDFFVRGIRSFSDFDSEFSMGIINRRLSGKETIFLMASSSRVHISSSRIRELSMYGKKLENFVPSEIEEEVYQHLFDFYAKNGGIKKSSNRQ